MTALTATIDEFGIAVLTIAAVAALVTSAIHGSVGVAGGFLMTAILAHLIGVKPVIPVMSVALAIGHTSRVLFNLRHVSVRTCVTIMLPAIPMIVVGGMIYGKLPANGIAYALGILIAGSIPVRHLALSRQIKVGTRALGAIGAVYGLLAGASTGSTMLLSPFILGAGLVKEAFVATLAVIQVSSNITRIAVFGTSHLLNAEYFALGIFVGVWMIPGNWIGRTVLRRMGVRTHSHLVDFFALIGAANFFYIAIVGR